MTEAEIIGSLEAVNDAIHRMTQQAISISIDDFGAGYSSLARLKEVPFSEIKIDRGLIRGCDRDPSIRYFLKAVRDFAHYHGARVVAEGVEDDCGVPGGRRPRHRRGAGLPVRPADAARRVSPRDPPAVLVRIGLSGSIRKVAAPPPSKRSRRPCRAPAPRASASPAKGKAPAAVTQQGPDLIGGLIWMVPPERPVSQALAAMNFTATISNERAPPGATTSTWSPTRLPIRARAIGEEIETRPCFTSASTSPTIW